MKSFEAALAFETCEETHPEDSYLSAYEDIYQNGFSKQSVVAPVYVSIDSAGIQHLSEIIAEDLPGLELPAASESRPAWETTEHFDKIGYTDEIEYSLVLQWAKAIVESNQRYELLRLLVSPIGDTVVDREWRPSPLYGYYVAKERATDKLIAFSIEEDEERADVIRIVEGQERHGLLGKLLLTKETWEPPSDNYPRPQTETHQVLNVRASDGYL